MDTKPMVFAGIDYITIALVFHVYNYTISLYLLQAPTKNLAPLDFINEFRSLRGAFGQAQALVYSLMRDETFALLPDDEKTFITDRILEEVRGRMLEDIVLLESMKALGEHYDVFKYRFASGEYDMVIYGKKEHGCAVYEINEQAKHLRNETMLSLTTPRFGALKGRYVLYLGEDTDTEDGIAYRNAEQFLKALPEISLTSGL